MGKNLIAGLLAIGLLGLVAAYPAWQNANPSAATPNGGLGAGMMATAAEHGQFESAVESGDYAAAKALSEKYGFARRWMTVLDEDGFELFSQLHSAVESGDGETAAKLRAQLFDKYGSKPGSGKGLGMARGKAFKNGFERGFGRGSGAGMRKGQGCPFENDDAAPSTVAG